MNPPQPPREDLKKVVDFVSQLDIRDRAKIVFNHNLTLDRRTYEYTSKNCSLPVSQCTYNNRTDLSEGEYSTLAALHGYCSDQVEKGKKSLVYYFHSKSTSKSQWREFFPIPDSSCDCCLNHTVKIQDCNCCKPTASWREQMNSLTLEFPSVCARALLKHGYSACGSEGQIGHYSGNFFWANCEHVAKLDIPRTRFDAWLYEYFVLANSNKFNYKFGYECGYSVFHCDVNRYDYECPRARYRDLLLRLTSPTEPDLPRNYPASHAHPKPRWTEELRHAASTADCVKLLNSPYKKYSQDPNVRKLGYSN